MILPWKQNLFWLILLEVLEQRDLMKNRFLILYWVLHHTGIKKPTKTIHAFNTGVYTSDKTSNMNTINKINLLSDFINGSKVDGIGQPIFFSFVLDKPSVFKKFSEKQTILYKNINKSVLTTITFYLENDNNEEVNFNGEKLTFTLQEIKIQIRTSTFG